MEIKTKQRWAGALVLLAILSILLPLLFHTSRLVTESRLSVKVPPKPHEPSVLLSTPQLEQKKNIVLNKLLDNVPKPHEPSVLLSIPQLEQKKNIVLNKVLDNAPKPKSQTLKKKTRLTPHPKPFPQGKRGAIRSTLMRTSEAWVIRLGTFSNKANADRLLKRLRHKGFDAYTRSLTSAQGKRLHRVYVGPGISLKNTKRLREKLKKTFRLNGVLSKYKI